MESVNKEGSLLDEAKRKADDHTGQQAHRERQPRQRIGRHADAE